MSSAPSQFIKLFKLLMLKSNTFYCIYCG